MRLMSSVIKKKKKSLLAKIIGGIKAGPLPNEEGNFASDIPLDDVCIADGDAALIASRRNDLRAGRHGNSDAMVIFDNVINKYTGGSL